MKNGVSPWREIHSVAFSVMNAVSDSSAGNWVGAHVYACSSAPGYDVSGWYRSKGVDGTSTPCSASHFPHWMAPCS